MKYELVAVADVPRFLTEIGGTPTGHPAPPGWVYVAVPELPDAIMAIGEHFTMEFVEEDK